MPKNDVANDEVGETSFSHLVTLTLNSVLLGLTPYFDLTFLESTFIGFSCQCLFTKVLS